MSITFKRNMLITYADRPVYRAQHNPGVTEGGKQEAAEKMEGPGD